MYASTVLNVSSFWPAGPHLNETLCPVVMPAHTSAEMLGCGYPQYHPFQITGGPSTNAYGDNARAFSPATKTGIGGFTTGGDQYLRFAFDPSASYERDGYTEFIVVGFPTALYVHTIEIGEVRGAGSIVRIKALQSETGEYVTLWESVDGAGDPRVQYRQQARIEYRVFEPYPTCETTFKTDTIRLEMDTRSVTDWNELDYIAMVGSSQLRSGVLRAGMRELMYVPNSDAEGVDQFGYAVSDCPFQLQRFSDNHGKNVGLYIVPRNDPPVATNLTISDLEEAQALGNWDGAGFDLRSLVSDVDVGDSLHFSLNVVGAPVIPVRARISNDSFMVLESELDGLPGARLNSRFDIEITATDSSMAKAVFYILYRPRVRDDGDVERTGALSGPAVAAIAIAGTLFAFGVLLACYCCVKQFHRQCLRAIIPGNFSRNVLFLSPHRHLAI
jgi:hypothetical protein